MNKRITIILCFAFSMFTGWSQNTVESIRERYSSAKNYIEKYTGDDQYDGSNWPEYYHVEAKQFLPGTGGHHEDVYLYWLEKEEDKVYNSHLLNFATKSYNYAARNFHEEYLYDADGAVAFIYGYIPLETMEGETEALEHEYRFYLNKGKLLQAIIKTRNDTSTSFKNSFVGTTLNTNQRTILNDYLKQAKKLHQMFVDIEKEAYDNEE